MGGLLAATLAAGIGSLLVGVEGWHALFIGPIVGLAGQAGDLAESMLKRAADRMKQVRGEAGFEEARLSYVRAVTRLAVARKERG